MAWISLEVAASEADAELMSDTLMSLGALSVSIVDAEAQTPAEKPVFGEPGDPPPGVWHHNTVSAMFDADDDIDHIIQALSTTTGIEKLHYATQSLEDQDWVRQTQSQFQPIEINAQLSIVPTWHEVADENKINIILDPGLAFGTGSHPTTHLCLDWLTKTIEPQQTVLDYGCGSGILAIAAKKLGAKKVLGTDIDLQAIEASVYNAKQNQVDIDFYDAENAQPQAYDGVVANILSSALSVLAPVLATHCKKGGRIALSGILTEQAEQLIEIYSQWFDMAPQQTMDAWVLLTGTKR